MQGTIASLAGTFPYVKKKRKQHLFYTTMNPHMKRNGKMPYYERRYNTLEQL